MKIFDTHIHLGLLSDDKIDILVALKSANRNNVKKFMTITNSISDFDKVYNMLKTEEGIYFAVGISPSDTEYKPKNWEEEIYHRSKLDKVIAIGETGLDYYKKFGDKKSQIELFIAQIRISDELKKPLVIHNRNASEDILEVLKNKKPTQNIVYHCYSDNYEFANESIKNFENIFISFAGNVTYKNQRVLFECMQKIPLERMVVESESPFMSPASKRNFRNKPDYIKETIEFIADTRSIDKEELSEILWQNSNKLFGIQD